MRYELNNYSIGLVEAFKNEPEPVAQFSGSGRKPPRTLTAVAMGEPEENRTAIPQAFYKAMEKDRHVNDDGTFSDNRLDMLLMLAFDGMDTQYLPGLDELLVNYKDLLTESDSPPSKEGLDSFMQRAHDERLLKPQNWKEKLLQPVKYALKRQRITSSFRVKR